MHSHQFTPGVMVTGGLLLAIAVISVYVSRVYLPAKIKSAYLKSITALAAAVETKDSGTVGHAQRVAELTVELARRMGVQGRDLERIQYAALLMDMGKAKVPSALLNKREPLTAKEWEIMKSHPQSGADMVAAVPFLADLEDYVLHHHELWDGSGYPSGLAGDEIPLASRILCVAADYDAMVSERPYHPRALSSREAMSEIQTSSATRYDPRVAEVFWDMLAREHGIPEPRAKAA